MKRAVFSPDRRYRYLLRRRVGESNRRALFVMLNPSAANERDDDPTIRRCIGFARDWGYGVLEVANLFALVSTKPEALARAQDPIGPRNDATIRAAMKRADIIILAWGNHGLRLPDRAARVESLARKAGHPHHLGITKMGAPRHPLYLPRDTQPTPF